MEASAPVGRGRVPFATTTMYSSSSSFYNHGERSYDSTLTVSEALLLYQGILQDFTLQGIAMYPSSPSFDNHGERIYDISLTVSGVLAVYIPDIAQ